MYSTSRMGSWISLASNVKGSNSIIAGARLYCSLGVAPPSGDAAALPAQAPGDPLTNASVLAARGLTRAI
jgi:hypothetical protein